VREEREERGEKQSTFLTCSTNWRRLKHRAKSEGGEEEGTREREREKRFCWLSQLLVNVHPELPESQTEREREKPGESPPLQFCTTPP